MQELADLLDRARAYRRAMRLHEAGVVVAISVGSGGWFDSITHT